MDSAGIEMQPVEMRQADMHPIPINDESHPGSHSTMKFARRPHLDGVRAIAATMVVLFHAKMPGFDNGYAGVDIFFVLSGFLITSLLVREIMGTSRVDLSKFYARRMRRLLPAAGVVLLITAVLYRWLQETWWILMHRDSFPAAALYYENFNALAVELDYFAEEEPRTPVMHYWSLSIEEQFYAVYPLAFAALLWFCQYRVTVLAGLFSAVAVVVAAHTLEVSYGAPMQAYFSSLGRTYQLIAGALLALYIFRREQQAEQSGDSSESGGSLLGEEGETRSHAPGLGWEVLPLLPLFLLVWNIAYHTEWTPVVLGLYTCVLSVALFLCLEFVAPDSIWRRVLSWTPFLFLGKLSYSMYLVHMPLCVLGDLAGLLPTADNGVARGLMVLVLTTAIACAMYYAVELPAMKVPINHRRLIIICGLAFTLTCFLALPRILDVEVSPEVQRLLDSRAADEAGGDGGSTCPEVPYTPAPVIPSPHVDVPPSHHEEGEGPDGEDPDGDGVITEEPTEEPTEDAAGTTPPAAGQGPRPFLLAAGDSYSDAWTEGLSKWAQQHDYRYTRVWFHGCMWLDVEQYARKGTFLRNCRRDLHKEMLKVIKTQRPFVTLLFSRSILVRTIAKSTSSKKFNALDKGWLELLEQATRERIAELKQYTNPVIVAPIPRPEGHAVRCISSTHVTGPVEERARQYNSACGSAPYMDKGGVELVAMWERLSKELRFKLLKLDFLCPDNFCPVYNRGMVTMKDGYHLADDYGTEVTPDFIRALADIGVNLLSRGCVTFDEPVCGNATETS